MVSTNFLYSLLTAAALLDSSFAGPCKHSAPVSSSTAVVPSNSAQPTPSSTVEASSSSPISSSSSLEATATPSSIDVTSSVSTVSSSAVEVTPSTTLEVTPSITAEVTPSSTFDPTSISSAEVTPSSSVESSLSSTVIMSSEITPSPSSTPVTSEVATTTSTLAPIVTTYALQATDSTRSVVNGQSIQYRSVPGAALYLIVPPTQAGVYAPVTFTLEESTNRLMIAGTGWYVVSTTSQALYAASVSQISSAVSYVSCESPVREGQPLSCVQEGAAYSARTQFRTSNSASSAAIYLMSPDTSTTMYPSLDLIAA